MVRIVRHLKSVALCLLMVLSPPSFAASVKKFSFQNWTGTASFNNASRQFERCTAIAKNENGISISYSVDPRFRWKLSFSHDNWSFIAGHGINANLTIGQEEYRGQRATITDGKTLEIQVDDPIALFERLRTGQELRVQSGGLVLAFSLAGSDEVLPGLVQCVTEQVNRRTRAASSTQGPHRPLQLKPASEPKAEVRSIAEAILREIGLTGYQFIRPKNVSRPLIEHVAWQKEMIMGSVSVVSTTESLLVERAPDNTLSVDGQNCTGKLFLIAASDVGQTSVSRTFAACHSLGGTMFSYFFTIPRGEGGFYQIVTRNTGLQFGSRRPAEELDNRIREVAPGIIARLAPVDAAAQ